MVDGGAISGIVISDMVAFRRDNMGYRRMTSSVVVFGATIYDMMTFKKEDIGDDSEVACGLVVSKREGRGGNGRLVNGRTVSHVVTLVIVVSIKGNRSDGKVVNGKKS